MSDDSPFSKHHSELGKTHLPNTNQPISRSQSIELLLRNQAQPEEPKLLDRPIVKYGLPALLLASAGIYELQYLKETINAPAPIIEQIQTAPKPKYNEIKEPSKNLRTKPPAPYKIRFVS